MNSAKAQYDAGLPRDLRALAAAEHDDLSIGNDAADTIERLERELSTKSAECQRLREALEACVDLLKIIALNARTIPDPRMDGTTDVYAVPIYDIEAIGGPLSKASAALQETQP